ncbi:hypothetical protein ACJ41O_006848 [Fusarium nematophilum]
MANGTKPARDELKNLQEDLGPYYQGPLKPRRSGTHSRENSFQESLRQSSNTPEPKRSGTKRQQQDHPSSSRDSTPNRPTKSRTRSHGQSFASDDASTPRRSPPPRSEPPSSAHNTPRPESASKPERHHHHNRGEIMSQRNRSGRASNRNNGNSHGEEVQIWELCKSQVGEIVSGINAENDSLTELVTMDKQVGAMDIEKIPGESLQQMEQLCRTGVKYSEANMTALKNTIEQLKVLRAVVHAKEQADAAAAGPGKRQVRDSAAAASSLYDFDGAGDSPVPSPIGGSRGKHGDRGRDRDRDRDRDSMPPKADSVEPQGSVGSGVGSGSSNSKSKVVFSRGDAVAFKPRAMNGGDQSSDWILGEVAQVLGEGKSRRYKVLDIEPDDQSKQKEYRSSASSMIPITPESQAGSLKDWESGKVVLALYPNTTTFYKAEVHSMDDGAKVNLKFEGENDSTTLQQVERRFVIEYRA